jgi:hypothetical protein
MKKGKLSSYRDKFEMICLKHLGIKEDDESCSISKDDLMKLNLQKVFEELATFLDEHGEAYFFYDR